MVENEHNFSKLYNEWFDAEGTVRQEVEMQLLSLYRAAWQSGSVEERIAVLNFLFWTRQSSGYDLITASLGDSNDEVAQNGACTALALISHGENLGSQLRRALEDFGRRHRQWHSISSTAIQLLDEEASRRSPGA